MTEDWQLFKGSRYQVAKALGSYWGKEYKKRKRKIPGVGCLAPRCDCFSAERLLIEKGFPKVHEEICGILDGINSEGVKATFEGVLREVLAEATGCATIGIRSKNRSVLSHNEEWDGKSPLCFAHVNLDGHRFLSVSYPFQLFGSAAGATSAFAFSGNSIDLDCKREQAIKRTRDKRIAKTILTRLLLDQHTFNDAKKILTLHPLLQANNLSFIGKAGNLLKAQIVPNQSLSLRALENQVRWIKATNNRICQTNYLSQDGELDGKHVDGTMAPEADIERHGRLNDIITNISCSDTKLAATLEKKMSTVRCDESTRNEDTLATITFEMTKKQMRARAIHFFIDKKGVRVRSKKV